MRPNEVEGLLAQVREREDKVKPKIAFGIGEMVKVADGPFQNQSGVVEEIDPERGKLRVSVSIFGRSTHGRTGILASRTQLDFMSQLSTLNVSLYNG